MSNVWVDSEQERKIQELLDAKYQLIYVITHEEDRLQEMLCEASHELSIPLYTWSFTSGMVRIEGNRPAPNASIECRQDPVGLIDAIRQKHGEAMFLLKDFHVFINGDRGFETIRALRDFFFSRESWEKSIIISSPVLRLPTELEKHAEVVEISLPGDKQIGDYLDDLHKTLATQRGEVAGELPEKERLIGALKGLTKTEIEAVSAKSITVHDRLDYDTFIEEKRQILKKQGTLDYYTTNETLDNVGGLGNLKKWLSRMQASFLPGAADFGVDPPRGVLLLGLPGTGKSLTAKATANVLGLPLIQFDLSKVMGSLYGQSEANMRNAIRIIEAVAPAVVMIDEIEKVLSGTESSGRTDGGTTDHLMGMMLNWMQEREKPIFFVGTANSLNNLPDHLIRAGRFDAVFFVDLPAPHERAEIIKIHLRKRGRNPEKFDIDEIVRATDGFSGAEIEQAVKEAIRTAWFETRGEKDVTTEMLVREASKIVPLSTSKADELQAIRQAARESRILPASEIEENVISFGGSKSAAKVTRRRVTTPPLFNN